MFAKSPARARSGRTPSAGCSNGSSTRRACSNDALSTRPRSIREKRSRRGTEDLLEATEAMVVVMEERATEAQVENVVKRLVEMGMDVHRSTGVTRTVLGAVGQGHPDKGLIEMLEGVHEVVRISSPFKLASKTFKPEG